MNIEPLNNEAENVKDDGETIDELAHRHMKDQNHVVTDQEIRDAKLDLDIDIDYPEGSLYEEDNTTIIPPIPGEPGVDETKDTSTKTTPPNPYDVMNS